MKRETLLGIGLVLVGSLSPGLACSGAEDAGTGAPAQEDTGGSSSDASTSSTGYGDGSSGYSSTTTSTGSGYGSGGGYDPGGGGDIGTGAGGAGGAGGGGGGFTCEGLDMSKPLVLYLSADDSNSMGSPAQARGLLDMGLAPYPSSIRTYEFLNYYHIDYDAPPQGTLAIFPDLGATSVPGDYDLQLGVRSFDAAKPRRPVTITFVLDTSGSMAGGPIERERAAVKAIAASLSAGDIVSLVTWNTDNQVVLSGHTVTGPNDATLLAAADDIGADGGTDLEGGLSKGYQLATQHYGANRLNRVVLVSDGWANVGETNQDVIGDASKDADKEGIYLVGVGTGDANDYNDVLMDVVTDKGRGAYVFIDSEEEAKAIFEDRFDETMEIAARGVQVELTLPWYFQMQKFYGEEYSTDPSEVTPQHLAPSDAMVFNQVLRACDPALVDPNDTVQIQVSWEVPLTYDKQTVVLTKTVGELLAAPKPALEKGKAIVAYAEALKTGLQADLHAAQDAANAANPSGTDPELSEIAALLAKHPAF
jgi:Ca-activated chloride channel family protein